MNNKWGSKNIFKTLVTTNDTEVKFLECELWNIRYYVE